MAEIENGWQQDMWNHVKFVYDTETVKAYVNGQEIYGKAATSEPGGK